MQFTIAEHKVDIDNDDVALRLGNHSAEPIQTHWVEIRNQQWPPKQALSIVTGIPRSDFISHTALRIFRALGFETSNWPAESRSDPKPEPLSSPQSKDPGDLVDAATTLGRFLELQDLTSKISHVEHQLEHSSTGDVSAILATAGIDTELLDAAITVRRSFGRINDVIHAATLALVLPLILREGEVIANRPSLAAGNDPSRPFDLETNLRIAEFKVSVWKGSDAMRKRGVFADLVHLSLAETDRFRQLFVVGDEPGRFLATTKSKAEWGLSRGSDHLRRRFEESFGSTDVSISEFRATHGSEVEIVDLARLLPGLLV